MKLKTKTPKPDDCTDCDLAAAQNWLIALREKRAVAEADLEAAQAIVPRHKRGHAEVQREAVAIVDEREPGPDEPSLDFDALEHVFAVADEAVKIQERRVREAGLRYTTSLYDHKRGEHAAVVDRLCNAVEELRDALTSEVEFRATFREHVGILPQVCWQSFPHLRKILSANRGQFRRDQRRFPEVQQ